MSTKQKYRSVQKLRKKFLINFCGYVKIDKNHEKLIFLENEGRYGKYVYGINDRY